MVPYRDDRDVLRQRITEIEARLQTAEADRQARILLEGELSEARRQLQVLQSPPEKLPPWSWGGFFLGPVYYVMAGLWNKALQLAILWGLFYALSWWAPLLSVLLLMLLHFFCGSTFFVHKRRWLDARRRCPYCAEIILVGAVVCRYCGRSDLNRLNQ